MAKPNHKDLISKLIADFPEIRRDGFWRAIRRLRDAEYLMDLFENSPEWRSGVGFVPDAWSIDYNTRHVHIFEAVVTHDVTDHKFAKMCDLAWALDEDHYTLCLTRCDTYSRTAYDVRGASIMNDIERARSGQSDTGWLVPNWQRFDTQAVRHFLEGSAR